jgi:PadR family transcriptional regulator, regulatory protein PadR
MDEIHELFEKWKSQVRKGYLELCILRLIEGDEETYGFDIMDSLNGYGLEVSEGTLYPLLARMVREKSLDAAWKTEGLGHPRKYYRLSEAGTELLTLIGGEFKKNNESYLAIESRRQAL